MTEEQLQYVEENISAINGPNFDPATIGNDGTLLFGSKTDFKNIINEYFIERLVDEDFKNSLIEEFRTANYVKARIPEIANRHLVLKATLQSYYDKILQNSIKAELVKTGFIDNALNYIKENIESQAHYRFSSGSIKKILEKQYDFIFSNGFPTNIHNINSGIMTANAGDSAQFLFLARAILAGFNCSNVDVRSSKYDAIIDFNNILLRIQIKGVSDNSISFKDRDRGGQGIDHRHTRNQGQRITAENCDIYVAVDKKVGICYLIPMSYVDTLSPNEIITVNLSTLDQYKENWDVILQVATARSIQV